MSCPIERRVRVTHSTMNISTGAMTPGRTEVRVQPCGTPLFGKDKARGICSDCAKGWEVEGNQPTERGREQIRALAKEAR